jgi:hypothetical protein
MICDCLDGAAETKASDFRRRKRSVRIKLLNQRRIESIICVPEQSRKATIATDTFVAMESGV